MAELPVGYRFNPTDEELISHYLYNKITGKPLSCDKAIVERDLYAGESPLEIFRATGTGTGSIRYFFTELSGSSKRCRRTIGKGKGSWGCKARDVAIVDSHKRTIGQRKQFLYKGGPTEEGKWIMHEFRLDPNPSPKSHLVLCRITDVDEKASIFRTESPTSPPLNQAFTSFDMPEAFPVQVMTPSNEAFYAHSVQEMTPLNEAHSVEDNNMREAFPESQEIMPFNEASPCPSPIPHNYGERESALADIPECPTQLIIPDWSCTFEDLLDGEVHQPEFSTTNHLTTNDFYSEDLEEFPTPQAQMEVEITDHPTQEGVADFLHQLMSSADVPSSFYVEEPRLKRMRLAYV